MPQMTFLLQQVVNLFCCNRRSASGTCTRLKGAPEFSKGISKKNSKSLGYRSNESTDLDSDPATLSTSGSDVETISSGLHARRSSKPQPPQGSHAPPGLESLGYHSIQKKRGVNYGRGSSEEAKTSVTKAVSRDCHLAQCLRKVNASSGSEVPPSLQEVLKRQLQREESGTAKSSLPLSLQQVLSKLTPEEAAVVNAAFQSKGPPRTNIPPNSENTLRSNLQKLATIDSKRIFMVRKIAKLGFKSRDLLKAYFSKFGIVDKVFVTHGIDKRHSDPNDPDAQRHFRPAGVGFVVMAKAEDVVNIFSAGLEHTVSGVVDIAVTAYEHHDPQETWRNEIRLGLPASSATTNRPHRPRFPTYANITEDNTLRSNLQKMAKVDADRIFMVRKINKLGLGSVQLLKTHFGRFGKVTNVFVTHNIDRRKIEKDNPDAKPLVRAAGIGFVVMDKAEDVAKVFQSGLEQTLYGVKIFIASYEHHLPDDAIPNDYEHQQQIDEEVI